MYVYLLLSIKKLLCYLNSQINESTLVSLCLPLVVGWHGSNCSAVNNVFGFSESKVVN